MWVDLPGYGMYNLHGFLTIKATANALVLRPMIGKEIYLMKTDVFDPKREAAKIFGLVSKQKTED